MWLYVHDAIEQGFEELFQRYENLIAERFGEVFDSIHGDFLALCDDTDTKDEKQKLMKDSLRNELNKNPVEFKKMIENGGEIPRLVAQCKSHNSQASLSQLAKLELSDGKASARLYMTGETHTGNVWL